MVKVSPLCLIGLCVLNLKEREMWIYVIITFSDWTLTVNGVQS